MSVYAVERVRQLMDWRLNRALEPLILASPVIERVEGWLEDEASRAAFRRELSFMVLRGLLRDDAAAIAHSGNISAADWNKALDAAGDRVRSGDIPSLVYPPSPDWMVPYLNASTFVLEQYRSGEEVSIRAGDVVLDCGAFCGETAVWAARQGAERVYCFEPNPQTLPYLRRNLELYAPGVAEVVPLALGEAPGRMEIVAEAANPGGSRLVGPDSGGAEVEVTTLDAWCEENQVKPDYIKMDLEGAEPAALKGARRILEGGPRLAISLYHNLSDMWVIPALIKELRPDYRFWCRKNAILVEFVLYGAVRT